MFYERKGFFKIYSQYSNICVIRYESKLHLYKFDRNLDYIWVSYLIKHWSDLK